MLSASDLLFGPMLLLLSLIGSLSDIKSHKIPNWLVVRALGISAVLNLVYFIFVKETSLIFYISFILVSFAASFTLWLLDFWKPGDVKFYFALSTFMHPIDTSNFLLPLVYFIFACVIYTLAETAVTRKFKFKPKFSAGSLLPLALSPFFSMMELGNIAIIMVLFLLGEKLAKIKIPILIASAVAFYMAPLNALRTLLVLIAFSFISWFKLEGKIPSAPFISGSFIYLFFFGAYGI